MQPSDELLEELQAEPLNNSTTLVGWEFTGYTYYNANGPTCGGNTWLRGATGPSACYTNQLTVSAFDANGVGAYKICLYPQANCAGTPIVLNGGNVRCLPGYVRSIAAVTLAGNCP